jgi:Zn-dependent protease/predicted transcriptional regulator
MSDSEQASRSPERSGGMERGLRVGRVAGIEIRLDSSLLIIFALVVYALGVNVFPDWHPDWSGATRWLTAVGAGLLFFVSVLLHELAHSLVAIRSGIPVPRITLFLFGGMAEISEEPHNPRDEFLIAIAGPATSLAIGVCCSALGAALAGAGFAERLLEDQARALAGLSPLSTLFFWLGPVNIVLGLFNLVPGFPMDGGRVLRAALWWLTGDLNRATRIASEVGRFFGWSLMVLGGLQALSGLPLQGLWLLLIGWFLSHTASASYRQLQLQHLLREVTARDLMRSHFDTVDVARSVGDFLDQQLMRSSQVLWPVTDAGRLVGLVGLEEVRGVPAAERHRIAVGQVMRSDLPAMTVAPGMDAHRALRLLNSRDLPLVVVEGGRAVGLLSQQDAMKWLLLHQR